MSSFEEEFPGLSESANRCMVTLVRAAEQFLDMTARALRHHDLSMAGRQALAVLDGAGAPLSPTTIAERLIVTTASVTSLLDTLERRGLVSRRPDLVDRRRVLVELTEAGRAQVDRVLPDMIALQTAVMTDLSEPQRRQLLALLDKVQHGVDAIDADDVLAHAPQRHHPR